MTDDGVSSDTLEVAIAMLCCRGRRGRRGRHRLPRS